MSRLARGVLLLALAATPAPGQERAPAFVPGEAIVRFRPASPTGAIVAALSAAPRASEPSTRPRLDALSEKLGIPVRLERIRSGGAVVLSVDFQALAGRLAARARQAAGVATAVEVVGDEGLLSPPRREVELRFSEGSAGAAQAARARREKPEEASPAALDVTRELAGALGLPLLDRITPRGAIRLAVDARAVTLLLVERLRAHPDVEYAQTNRVVEPLGGARWGPGAGDPAARPVVR